MFDRPPRPVDESDDDREPKHFRSSGEQGKSCNDPAAQPIDAPTVEDNLKTLRHLSSSVALGLLTPAQANVIQRNLRTEIDVRLKQQKAKATGVSLDELASLYREDPKTLRAVAPFLTPEHVEWILTNGNDSTE